MVVQWILTLMLFPASKIACSWLAVNSTPDVIMICKAISQYVLWALSEQLYTVHIEFLGRTGGHLGTHEHLNFGDILGQIPLLCYGNKLQST